MKIVSDLSVTAHRVGGANVAWDTYWKSPLSQTAPALVMDFAANAYGVDGAAQTLSAILSFFRSSSASYVDASGQMQTAAIDTPRLDHDPNSLAPAGLLVESATTNLIVNSDVPAGQTVTVTANPHVLSFYGTGTVTLGGAHVASVTGTGAFPDRTELTFTPTAGDLTIAFAGSITAPQLEERSSASSYVATGASAQSRSEDVPNVGLGAWFSSTAGTIVFSGSLSDAAANDRLVEVDAGDTSTRLSVLWNTTLSKPQFQVWSSGALQAAIAPGGNAVPLGNSFRVAVAYAANDFAISLDGSTAALDALGTMPTGLTTMRLGRSIWGAQGLSRIESVVYYPTRLSDAELEALSA